MNQKNNDAIHKAIMDSGKKSRSKKVEVTIACPYCGNTDLIAGGVTYGCDWCCAVFPAGPIPEDVAKAIAEILPKLVPDGVPEELSDAIPPEVAKYLPRKKK